MYVIVCCDGTEFLLLCSSFFFFQAEDGIRDLVRSRGLGDVYKRQTQHIKGLDFFNADISAGVSLSTVGDVIPENYSFFLSLIHI